MTNARGLTITVVDIDPDYLGIEIRASNERFSGATRIYAGLAELSELADHLAGFPSNLEDERKYQFGTREPGFAGGYCSLHLHCIDRAGHARIDITLDDDDRLYESASVTLGFRILAADLDRFITRLRELDRERFGEANLPIDH